MSANQAPRAAVVVGNPKPASRTLAVAESLARAVLGAAGEIDVIELAPLGGALFGWGDSEVATAKKAVLDSDLLLVASPVYKASYTGLLKAFLDQFGRDELAALPTVPVMVGAGAAHALAVETHLRPVLVELGASCPTRGIYVMESELEGLNFDDWLSVWGEGLRTLIAARAEKTRIR